MKSKDALKKISEILGLSSEIKLAEVTTADGAVLYAETFDVGSTVYVITDGAEVVAPAGEYELQDGTVLTIGENGALETITPPATDETTDEVDASELESIRSKVQDLITEKDGLKAKTDTLKGELTEKENELKEMKTKLSKIPATAGVRKSPEGAKPQKNHMALSQNRRPSTKSRVYTRLQNTVWDGMQVNLDTTFTQTSTYAGEAAADYISPALFEGASLSSGIITIRPNVKFKEVVRPLAVSAIVADATCAFTPIGTVAITERILEPKSLEVNLEICKLDLHDNWDAVSMGYSAHDTLPPSFQQYLIAETISVVAEANEVSLYQGDATNDGEFDGLETLMDADGSVIGVNSTTVTVDNVIEEMGKVVDAVPDKVISKDDLTLVVSTSIWRLYQRALGGFVATVGAAGYKDEGTTTAKPLFFEGIPVFPAQGMTAGKMMAFQASNVWFGTGLMDDQNEVAVKDMSEQDLSRNVRFAMAYTAAVQYGFSDEIVYYRPTP